MYRGDKPVAVVPNIENHESVHVVRIWECPSQLFKTPPSRSFCDFDPGAKLSGGFTMLLARLLQAFNRDDVHSLTLLRNLRSVKSKGAL
jgi:hypothetical protein